MINVTKTFLPPQSEYQELLNEIWDNGWITNRGEMVRQLEEALKLYLNTPSIIAMTNGTLPLQIAIKALEIEHEVITTPFSYVATASSLFWEGCQPVFVDIHPDYLTIDETKIESAITSKTSAIVATHVFGNPCNVEVIQKLAEKYNLKVIYDAAHCFGVKYKGQSVFNYGDVSTCSFHATKLFHTGEGGALFCKKEYYDKMFYHHNFGHDGQEDFFGLGINAKMSELQAAMGLSVFKYIDKISLDRKKAVQLYEELLVNANIKKLKIRDKTDWNYSYFPVILESEQKLLSIQRKMNKNGVFPRRYFYPSLNTIAYLKGAKMPISEDVSKRILCLPLYYGLKLEEIKYIVKFIYE